MHVDDQGKHRCIWSKVRVLEPSGLRPASTTISVPLRCSPMLELLPLPLPGTSTGTDGVRISLSILQAKRLATVDILFSP
jgi:hypothetical protein